MNDAEKAAFGAAVVPCWNPASEAAGVKVVLGFALDRVGMPDPGSFRLIGDPGADPAHLLAYEAARRAVLRCANGGYRLPVDKYDAWGDVELTFSPVGVEGVN
ncbi:MAG: hypothetical protein ACK5LJ_16410 [Paracoccus sp. (in: a-proteobacteria)]